MCGARSAPHPGPRLGTAPETRTSLVRPQPHPTRLSGLNVRAFAHIRAQSARRLAFVGCGSCRDGLRDAEINRGALQCSLAFVLSRKRHQHLAGSAPRPGSFDDQGREHDARSSRATCRRLARSPPLQGSFRASLRSQIATGQQNRPMQSRQTRDKTLRRQIEKLAQPLSWVPPLFFCFICSEVPAHL